MGGAKTMGITGMCYSFPSPQPVRKCVVDGIAGAETYLVIKNIWIYGYMDGYVEGDMDIWIYGYQMNGKNECKVK